MESMIAVSPKDIERRLQEFLEDPMIIEMNRILSNMFACMLPRTMILKDGIIVNEYDPIDQARFDKWVKRRHKYIKSNYSDILIT